jgi:hypothetical protein
MKYSIIPYLDVVVAFHWIDNNRSERLHDHRWRRHSVQFVLRLHLMSVLFSHDTSPNDNDIVTLMTQMEKALMLTCRLTMAEGVHRECRSN